MKGFKTEKSLQVIQDILKFNLQLSTLLAVPDHPKESMLYLLKALMTFQWSSPILPLRFISLLGAYAQGEYPYQFNGGKTFRF